LPARARALAPAAGGRCNGFLAIRDRAVFASGAKQSRGKRRGVGPGLLRRRCRLAMTPFETIPSHEIRCGGKPMKAVLLTGHGGPEMLRYGDAPDPVAAPGEVVVDIHAASVNAADYKVRLGNGRYRLTRFPHILGRDFSGVVSALGAGVS